MATELCNACVHCRKPVKKALVELTDFHQVIINRYKREVDELHGQVRSNSSNQLQKKLVNGKKILRQQHQDCQYLDGTDEQHVIRHLHEKIQCLEQYQESLWEIITADRRCIFEQQLTNVAIKAVNRIFACDNKDLRIHKDLIVNEFEDFIKKTNDRENDFAERCKYLSKKYAHVKDSYKLCRRRLRHIVSYGSLEADGSHSFQIFPDSLSAFSSDSENDYGQTRTSQTKQKRKHKADNEWQEEGMVLLQRLNTLEAENSKLKLEQKEHVETIAMLNDRYNKSMHDVTNDALHVQFRALQSDHSLIQSEHKRCEDYLETCRRDAQTMQSHLREEQAKRVRLESQVSELNTSKQKLELELDKAIITENQLHGYIAELKHSNDIIQKQLEVLEKKHHSDSKVRTKNVDREDDQRYERQIADMHLTIEDLKNKLSRQKSSMERESEMKRKLTKAIHDLQNTRNELDDVKTRLSSMMGRKLTDNNPNITDLSDKHRATKIAEQFTELYDNQWTDAFDVLDTGEDRHTIRILLAILRDTMEYCSEQTTAQMRTLMTGVTMSPIHDNPQTAGMVLKLLKDCRKAAAETALTHVFRVYLKYLNSSTSLIAKEAQRVPAYVRECFDVCWWMCVQDPPVVLGPPLQTGDTLDTGIYKAYTVTGTRVDYEVWPALYLHVSGPLLCKGVAQGASSGTTKSQKKRK